MKTRSWSYSEFSLALQCQRRYKHVVIDKIKPESLESGDMAFGSALHAALNALLKKEDGQAVFRVFWDTYKDKKLFYSRFAWPELSDLGERFIARFERKEAHKYVPHTMEERLYGEYKGIKLEGTADFYGEYDGILTVSDFKTTAYAYEKSKILHSLQLNLYAFLGMQCLDFEPEALCYVPFVKATGGLQGVQKVTFDREKMFAMLDDMVTIIEGFSSSFPKNPNICKIGSNECPFIETCWGKITKEGEE